MQRYANLLDFVKSFPKKFCLQRFTCSRRRNKKSKAQLATRVDAAGVQQPARPPLPRATAVCICISALVRNEQLPQSRNGWARLVPVDRPVLSAAQAADHHLAVERSRRRTGPLMRSRPLSLRARRSSSLPSRAVAGRGMGPSSSNHVAHFACSVRKHRL